jgi:hypothetical protein
MMKNEYIRNKNSKQKMIIYSEEIEKEKSNTNSN